MDPTRFAPGITPSVVELPGRDRSSGLPLGYGEFPTQFIKHVSEVIRPESVEEIKNLPEALDLALESPVGQLRMQDFLEPHHRVLVIVSDKARRMPREEMLNAVHRELPHIPHKQFTILIANGTHKPSQPEELGLSKEIIDRYSWISHRATRWRDLRFIGKTPTKLKRFFLPILKSEIKKSWRGWRESRREWWSAMRKMNIREIKDLFMVLLPIRLFCFFMSGIGMPIFVNKALLKANWIICLGQIQPHYFCGFSGGMKSIFPGASTKFSIAFNHFMKVHPTARIGRTEGNIVRDDIESVVKFLPKITILNIVSGTAGKSFGVVSGDPILAHREGVKICKKSTLARFKNRSDIVVVAAADPLGKSLYQLAKALVPASMVVKPGGTIICTGSCRDGVGGSTLILNQIIYRNGIQNYIPEDVSIRLIGTADPREVNQTFFTHSPSLTMALEEAFERYGSKGTLSVIPEAAHLIVYQGGTI